jgi:hypothetical protein
VSNPTRQQLREAIARQRDVVLDWETLGNDHRRDGETADHEQRRAAAHLAKLIALYQTSATDDGEQ